MSGEPCVPLSGLRAGDLQLAGGKGANLGELIAAGFAVPPGFVVTTDAYRGAVGSTGRQNPDAVRALPIPAQLAAAIARSYAELGDGPVAVRSSATAEDLPGAAFAGQQDSYLGVIGERQVIEAVRDCWASLWTERAVEYRAWLDIAPEQVAMAVVVQRMVDADHAGVMFTADPVTGARDRVVIDSNPGLGEAVVSGLVTPDHLVLDAEDRVVEERAGRRELVVRPAAGGGTEQLRRPAGAAAPARDDLIRLAATGRRIAAHFGRPQDIEWAIADGRIAVLQARPMTALPPPPVRLSRVQLLTGPVILELLPRRPYPMELTAWTRTVGQHVEGLVGGLIGARVDIDRVLIAEDAVMSGYLPFAPHPTLRTPARLIRSLFRMGRDPRGWRRDRRYRRYRDGSRELADLDLAAASWQQLMAVPESAARLVGLITDLRVGYLPAAAGAMLRLRLLLAILRRPGLFADLLLELPTETSRANAALGALADRFRATPSLSEGVVGAGAGEAVRLLAAAPDAAAARQDWADFLAGYGHRETGSILLLRDPSWADDPATVMALVQVLMTEGAATGSPFPDSLRRLLRHPVVRALRAEPWLRRLVTKASAGVQVREDTHFELTRTMPTVRRAVGEAGRRLALAGAIDAAEDVWYLTWGELETLPDPRRHPVGDRLRTAAARRRSAFAELAGSPLIATATLYPRAPDADALVAGVGGGGGRATGPVRVIHGPSEFGELRPGEVLVCPATNPSWTPLFARAAAVVVDHGGLASHAAIVAREYGIPAVMGTGDGSRVLATGVRVIVDGDRGRVTAASG